MGMYDDIVISKSYMRNLLTKKQEKILNTCKSNDYQTKSLDNCMLKYSFYRSKLYKADYNWEKKSFEKRKPVKFTGTINAYRTIKIKDDTYWIEVNFTVDRFHQRLHERAAHVAHPVDGLQLWVNHQRPTLCDVHDDAILDGEAVSR